MRVLFIHQNFPGQYKHLAPRLAADPANRVTAIGDAANLHGRPAPPGVAVLGYPSPKDGSPEIHPYLRSVEGAVRRGQALARAGLEMKRQGFTPDVICAHAGWGEPLYLRDVFPDSRILAFHEFYYRAAGADIGFDPEFPSSIDDVLRARTRNAPFLLSLADADWAVTPTRWQRAQFPDIVRDRISVIFDGIDTDAVTPDPAAVLEWPERGIAFSRGDEVVTYVARNLEPYRGFHIFMRALPDLLARRPKAHVVIVGGDEVSYGRRAPDGRTWREVLLEEVGRRLDPDRVHFLGRVPYGRFLSILRVSRAHVYLTYPFVLSWSMLEAMAAGCVVIGSATPPVQEVIAHGDTGFLVDFFDSAGLAAAVDRTLQWALDDAEGHAAMGARARRLVMDRYDLVRRCLPAHQALIAALAAGRIPPDPPLA